MQFFWSLFFEFSPSVEIWPRFLEVPTEEGVWIMADVIAYVSLGEAPFFRFVDLDVGAVFIADASILTNDF